MRTINSISMKPLRDPRWPRLAFVLSFLFLATYHSTLCQAFSHDLPYNGFVDGDSGRILDSLFVDSHESHLVARQSNESVQLHDNAIVPMAINPETTQFWTFSPSELNITGSPTLYITISACTQPSPAVGLNTTEVYENNVAPRLQLFVSINPSNTRPGPGSDPSTQQSAQLSQGFANFTLSNVSSNVYISVAAPSLPSEWQGQWTYQLGTSTSKPLQNVVLGGLFVIDTSQTDVLVTTGNLTSSELQPFEIYAVPKSSDYVISSLSSSFCSYRLNPSLLARDNVNVSMTTRGIGGQPKQQFYLTGLNASTEYNIYLTLPSNSTTDAGIVYTPSVTIRTKTSDNCQLVFNLPFCSEIAYAVPANPSVINNSALAEFFDSTAKNLFTNFSATLQLYPCNTSSSALYSLFRSCADCSTAYQSWLCAVTIPRCADVTDTAPYLYDRPVNSSRNPLIDQVVQPGAYKEVMPCSSLCYGLEQNCPSTLGFQCPLPGSFAMQNSYVEDDSARTCNAPQLQYVASIAGRVGIQEWVLACVLVHLAFGIMWGIDYI